jgi:hypothetical protein
MSRVWDLVVLLLLVAGPAAAQSVPLTVNIDGPGVGTVAVIGPGGGFCSTPVAACTFQVPTGAAIRIAANAPFGQAPGRLSFGSGPAAACALTTCGVTMTAAAALTVSFNAGDGPIASVTSILAGDGTGSIVADNSRCQNFDPAQSSTCTTVYLQGSSVAVSAPPAAGNRFAGYGGGVCGPSAACSFSLTDNATVIATFHPFTRIVVTPHFIEGEADEPAAFAATATYTDGVSEPLLPGPGTWVRRTPLPAPRYGLGAVTLNETLFAIGGIENGAPSATVTAIEPAVPGTTWRTLSSMLVPREGFAVATSGNTIWALGGNTTGSTVTSSIDRYVNGASNPWILIRAMPTPRRYLGAAFYNETLFAIGGETVIGGVASVVGTVEAARPPFDWTTKASMPTPRKAFAGLKMDSIFYAIGGIDAAGNPVATVEAYDLATNIWTTRTPMPAAIARPTAAVIDPVIYVMDESGTTYQYDTQADSWTVKSSVPTPRSEMAAALVKGIVYAIGGRMGGTAPSSAVEAFTDTMRWGGPDAVAGRLTQQGVARPPVSGLFDVFAFIGDFNCTMSGLGSCGAVAVKDPTRVLGALDAPANGSTVSSPFLVQGWTFQRRASSGTCVDAVHVYARTVPSGTTTFLGAATYGIARPDVAAVYGSQYVNSGYSLSSSVTLPAGQYAITAYAHNVCSGFFVDTGTMTSSVTVGPPVTTPRISIDAPSAGAVVTSAFEVGGWAIDTGAPSGTGVDGIQFYVQPAGDAAPGVFVGTGSYGIARADVGAMFGNRFTNSGFHFTITGLGPGSYTLGAYAHSTVAGAYTVVKTIPFTVNANQLMSIDVPGPEAVVTGGTFKVAGWSIDRTTAGGTGVDALHLYAFPEPADGRAPIFLGVATVGIARPDVAALYGARYENSGYTLTVDAAASGLTPGSYKIAVHSHSTSGSFNNVAVVQITIQ